MEFEIRPTEGSQRREAVQQCSRWLRRFGRGYQQFFDALPLETRVVLLRCGAWSLVMEWRQARAGDKS